jgi:hypothetical protein
MKTVVVAAEPIDTSPPTLNGSEGVDDAMPISPVFPSMMKRGVEVP